jgi:hypothetical protein
MPTLRNGSTHRRLSKIGTPNNLDSTSPGQRYFFLPASRPLCRYHGQENCEVQGEGSGPCFRPTVVWLGQGTLAEKWTRPRLCSSPAITATSIDTGPLLAVKARRSFLPFDSEKHWSPAASERRLRSLRGVVRPTRSPLFCSWQPNQQNPTPTKPRRVPRPRHCRCARFK